MRHFATLATVAVLLGHGDGTFDSPRAYENCSGLEAVQVADFDGDGTLDLVSPCRESNAAGILWGSGDGSFPQRSRFAAGHQPRSVATGDINHDGRLDFAVGNFASKYTCSGSTLPALTLSLTAPPPVPAEAQ